MPKEAKATLCETSCAKCATAALHSQLVAVASASAPACQRMGASSAATTHVTTPHVAEKVATKASVTPSERASRDKSFSFSACSSTMKYEMADCVNMVSAIPSAPATSSGRRPKRSMSKKAGVQERKLTTPMRASVGSCCPSSSFGAMYLRRYVSQ